MLCYSSQYQYHDVQDGLQSIWVTSETCQIEQEIRCVIALLDAKLTNTRELIFTFYQLRRGRRGRSARERCAICSKYKQFSYILCFLFMLSMLHA